MIKIWEWIKNNPNRAMFIVPIILVAIISISHVVSWYDIMNPYNWAIYLSIAIEIGAMTALVAATNKIKGGVWIMFGLVTFIQMIGNIFFSYKEIDTTGDLFKSWMELTGPVWEALGSDVNDVIVHKRWLAFLGGGLLPIISLTSLHFFIKYEDPNKKTLNEEDKKIKVLVEDKKETLTSEYIDVKEQEKLNKKIIARNKEDINYDNLVNRVIDENNRTDENLIKKEEMVETITTTNVQDNINLTTTLVEKEEITITNTTTEKNQIIELDKDIKKDNTINIDEVKFNNVTNNPTIYQEETNTITTTLKEIFEEEITTTTTTTTEGKRILTYIKE